MTISTREVLRRLGQDGLAETSRRAARVAASFLERRFDTASLDFPLLPQDVADSTVHRAADGPATPVGTRPLKIAWLCTPPSPGSGGHTTFFRMAAALERRGAACTVLLYNRHGSDPDRARQTIRANWPWLAAEVQEVGARIAGFDAVVASSWETAHVSVRRGQAPTRAFYFIQDYEPYFHPRGSLYSLAEDSYRLGLTHIALGPMVAEELRRNVGAEAVVVPFGCDAETYRLLALGPRSGVAFFARSGTDRRGGLLGRLALEELHRRRPDVGLRAFGGPMPAWTVPHEHLGVLSPSELNAVYNRSKAGMALSFTNVSLVPGEMLAAGLTPVVNDDPLARAVLEDPRVIWARPTPGGIADGLCEALDRSPELVPSSIPAHSGWDETGNAVADIIESGVRSWRR
ncbi:glycosyltransferase family 1 protein [Sinomonas sp. G460-2]|uniref:glycosyltransferase family 1 protein n=1 Tax=Sinomonas sp. G460-2 TaxID=3393464 RepID=UPI0039EFD15C